MKNFFGKIVVIVVIVVTIFLFCGNLGIDHVSATTFPDYGDYFIESFSWMNIFNESPSLDSLFGRSGGGVRYYNSESQRERYDFTYANERDSKWTLSIFLFYKNNSVYTVWRHPEGSFSCSLGVFEEAMEIPFGSPCEFKGEAAVQNRKCSRWDCPFQEFFLETDAVYFRTIYTENDRLQHPLREGLSVIYDGDLDGRKNYLLMDIDSFEERKPPNNTFKLPSECYNLKDRRSLSQHGVLLFPSPPNHLLKDNS